MILKLLLNTQMMWMVIYKNIAKYSPNKKRKILIVFEETITDMLTNEKFNPIVH